jgi:hypothetical protein
VKEVALPARRQPILVSSFLACLAAVLELPLDRLPQLPAADDPATGWAVSRWLGGLGLGIARVAGPAAFSWPGPWLARVRPPAGGQARYVVMYGVPSGVAWDPAGDAAIGSDWIEDGFIIAAADIALALPGRPGAPSAHGIVEGIWTAEAAGKPAHDLPTVQALAGRGLAGDRQCRGMRLCEPCKVAERYAGRPILRALIHRGGLRADILHGGQISVGDHIQAGVGADHV